MLKSIAGLQLRSKLRQSKARTGRCFPEWNQVNRIALLIEEENGVSKQQTDAFVQSLQKFTEVYYLELKNKTESFADWTCLTRRSKNILGLPVKELSLKWRQTKYDLVINTCNRYAQFATALCSDLQSQCICSASDHSGHSDLIILRKDDQNLMQYLDEVVRYLKMIKSRNP